MNLCFISLPGFEHTFSLLLLQVIMNPFYDMNKKIESPNFERKVTVSAKKYLLG